MDFVGSDLEPDSRAEAILGISNVENLYQASEHQSDSI